MATSPTAAPTAGAMHTHTHNSRTEEMYKVATLLLSPLMCAAAVFIRGSTSGGRNEQHQERDLQKHSTARERVGLLPHAVATVSAFLDVAYAPRWTIPKACEHGHLAMLPRLASREPTDMNRHYRAHLFSQGLVHAAQRGDLPMVQWLCCEYCPSGFAWKGLEAAASTGQLSVLQWLVARYNEYMQWEPPLMDLAATHGHFVVVQWLREYFPALRTSASAMYTAISNRDLRVIEWMHHHCNAATRMAALPFAVRYGTLEIAKTFGDRIVGPVGRLSAWMAAVESKNVEIVQWVFKLAGPPLASTVARAMEEGHLDVMKWLHANVEPVPAHMRGGRFGERAMDKAAGRGHIETLLWLHEHYSTECSALAMDNAAANGHLEIVKWLHANRSEGCSTRAMDRAAQNGHVDVLEWMHANRSEGCSASAVRAAVAFGRLDVLQWFHVNALGGFGAFVMDVAATYGHLHVVQWLHAHRSEGCTTRAMDGAAEKNHLETVQWLHVNRREGCTARAMDLAAIYNHLEMVQWLHANRTEGCTAEAMNGAASLEMVQWLHENRSEGCTTDAMANAVSRGDFELVLWLHEHRSEGCTPEAVEIAVDKCHAELFQWLHETYPDAFRASGVMDIEVGGEFFDALMHHMGLH